MHTAQQRPGLHVQEFYRHDGRHTRIEFAQQVEAIHCEDTGLDLATSAVQRRESAKPRGPSAQPREPNTSKGFRYMILGKNSMKPNCSSVARVDDAIFHRGHAAIKVNHFCNFLTIWPEDGQQRAVLCLTLWQRHTKMP